MEEWKWIEGYEGIYQVSNQGRLRSYQAARKTPHVPHFLRLKFDHKGYLRVMLRKDGEYKEHKVHRLVAGAFIPRVKGAEHINHIDGVKTNNGAANLEWVTQAENSRLAYETGLLKKPQFYQAKRKVTDELATELVRLFNEGYTAKEIALMVGMRVRTVQDTIKKWRTSPLRYPHPPTPPLPPSGTIAA